MSATLKPDLRDRIAGLSAVTSAGATVGIDKTDQGANKPRIRLTRDGYRDMDDLFGPDDSLLFETFDITVYGKTSLQAETLGDAITDDLESLTGNLGSSRRVVGVEITDKNDDYSDDDVAMDAGESIVQITTEIQHVPQ